MNAHPSLRNTAVYFRNYFDEDFDVDDIQFTFFNDQGAQIATLSYQPSLGMNPDGEFANPVVTLLVPLPQIVSAKSVKALLSSNTSTLDFQGLLFGYVE